MLVIGVNWATALVRRGQVRREKERKASWAKWVRLQEREGEEGRGAVQVR